MEGPKKRRKLHEYNGRHNEEARSSTTEDVNLPRGWSQESTRFDGQGISNHNGSIDIRRDFIGLGLSHKEKSALY